MYDPYRPVAEDNRNGVLAISPAAIVGSDYAMSWYFKHAATPVLTSTLKSSFGNLKAFNVTNTNAAIRWLIFFDGPDTSSAILAEFQIPLAGQLTLGADFFGAGLPFQLGLTYGISTTEGSYVAATASEHTIMIGYR